MVSPAVLDQIDPDSLQIGGQQWDITTPFADIRSFTSFSEINSPEELVAVLNRYLAAGAEPVLANEGTVDKFLGDTVMAWFSSPLTQPDHTLLGVRAALDLRSAIEKTPCRTTARGASLLWCGYPLQRSGFRLDWDGQVPGICCHRQLGQYRQTHPGKCLQEPDLDQQGSLLARLERGASQSLQAIACQREECTLGCA